MRSVRIGAGQGFYGDTLKPAIEMAKNGNVKYLCFDCLAELTMAILQKDRKKDSSMGYTKDVVPVMKGLLPICVPRGIKLITNTGGVNPQGAATAVAKIARDLGLNLRIATVTGDDLLERLNELQAASALANLDKEGAPAEEVISRLVFANAYLGAGPILKALQQGADVVITGRTTDTAQYLAAAAFEFGWRLDDLDRAAQGVVLGHILECTPQVTGGNFSGRWWEVENLENIGYPLAEIFEDGSFIVSKTPGTGGLVSSDTVREQLLYEIHDPSNFISPDVIIDMTGIRLEDVGPNQVKVSGAVGRPGPTSLKVVGGYPDGFVGEGRIVYTWPDAYPKAKKTEELLRKALVKEGIEPQEIRAEYLGINAIHGDNATQPVGEPTEVMLRFAVRTATDRDAAKIGRILPPLALGGPPHAILLGGMAPVRELMGIGSFLVDRELVEPGVEVKIEEI